MGETAVVREVGLRDGLQLVPDFVPTETKLDWCRLQAACGFGEMEVTSFVPAKVIPQFADAGDVLEGAQKIDGLKAAVLVPNVKGAFRAMDRGAQKINFVISASLAHNRANVRRTVEESVQAFRDCVTERDDRGLKQSVELGCGIATAFGCTIQGTVDVPFVLALAEELVDAGADELTIADTVGYADPVQVRTLFDALRERVGDVPLAGHFHDTRGMGISNVMAAVDAGVRRFDASLGGLGGCPFAPGATGNIATEDCVYLLESIGLDTGIDLDELLRVREQLSAWVPSEQLWGRMLQAGPAKTFRAAS